MMIILLTIVIDFRNTLNITHVIESFQKTVVIRPWPGPSGSVDWVSCYFSCVEGTCVMVVTMVTPARVGVRACGDCVEVLCTYFAGRNTSFDNVPVGFVVTQDQPQLERQIIMQQVKTQKMIVSFQVLGFCGVTH